MKKIIFLILGMILFSCEKPKELKDECWICTDLYNNIPDQIICDPVLAAHENGRRGVINGKWHYITCVPK